MRSPLALFTAFFLSGLLTLSACSSGEPSDPAGSLIAGPWELVYGSGMTYSYSLTDEGGDIGGTVEFVYLGTPMSTTPVTGTREGTHVELNHNGPGIGRGGGFTIHYVLTLSADRQRMTGYGENSVGPREENVVIARPSM